MSLTRTFALSCLIVAMACSSDPATAPFRAFGYDLQPLSLTGESPEVLGLQVFLFPDRPQTLRLLFDDDNDTPYITVDIPTGSTTLDSVRIGVGPARWRPENAALPGYFAFNTNINPFPSSQIVATIFLRDYVDWRESLIESGYDSERELFDALHVWEEEGSQSWTRAPEIERSWEDKTITVQLTRRAISIVGALER